MTRRNFKLGFIVTISLLLPFFQFSDVYAATSTPTPKVVINEIQTNGTGTGTTGQEFIELKNVSNESVDISGWKVLYVSSSSSTNPLVASSVTNANFSSILSSAKTLVAFGAGTVLYPNGFVVLTPEPYLNELPVRITYTAISSGLLSASGASLAMVDEIGVIQDFVGWGAKSALYEESPSVLPVGGSSIQRKVVDGTTQDTDNNLLDFEPLTTPTPQTENTAPTPPPADVPPTETPPIDTPPGDTSNNPVDTTPPPTDTPPTDTTQNADTTTPTVTETTNQQTYQPVLLNELFIDPISPLTDANDEWVELYNPNETEQNLAGYTIYAGTTYAYHHTFTTGDIIPAKGYVVVTSGATSIALSNGGGSVKIVGPTGSTYDETSYNTAPENTAWAKDTNGMWVWTTTPTESAQNSITQPVASAIVANAAQAAKKTSTTTKKATTTTAKATTAKTSTSKTAAKTTKVLAATDVQADSQLVAAPTPLPVWLLAVLGVLAVLYSGYEYRFDIANKFHQLRRH